MLDVDAVQKDLAQNLRHYGVVVGDEPMIQRGCVIKRLTLKT